MIVLRDIGNTPKVLGWGNVRDIYNDYNRKDALFSVIRLVRIQTAFMPPFSFPCDSKFKSCRKG